MIATLMGRQYAVEVIAEIVGIEPDYCRKATRRIAAERNVDYNPGKEAGADELLSTDSATFRNNLSAIVSALREKHHPVRLGREIGLTQSQQVKAVNRGGTHNYKLSELERIARLHGEDFTTTMIKCLLKPISIDEKTRAKEELRYRQVLACLNI